MACSIQRILFLPLIIFTLGCNSQNNSDTSKHHQDKARKINGITFVATRNPIDDSGIKPLNAYHANYAAIVPYAWMRSLDNPEVIYSVDQGWWGEKPEGVRKTIELMHEQHIEVMLKPQIWIGRGSYTGDIQLKDEASWQVLEKSYTDYILRFAKIAEEKNVGMFCIGTELDSFTRERPQFWLELISQIRAVYSGKLTYAGNWDSYKKIDFWSALDYIGVDAYFPISSEKTPEVDTVNQHWSKWKKELRSLSRKHNKKILFAEYGYISADYAGQEPWKNAGEDRAVNEQAQQILLEGLYNNIWDEEWFAGGFLWKHHAEKSRRRGYEKRFTVQNKLAQSTVSAAYKKYKE
ncbi:glycoside hydrolase family 113 [Nonlabens xiamenensis]|uniref:glycoside hydrolase family 113 n=1 Tax=Nonlabens xiamenensis TaxID=2341043 RepID=UPI000F60FFA7|nr:glycoside hydrolase [Nonlabens xiamenensis]